MGLIARLLDFVRGDVDGAHVSDATIDPGGGANITAPHYSCPGDDSVPLPGDFVATIEGTGAGGAAAVGYLDSANAGEAQAGEKRLYSRDGDGEVVAIVWLKNDGNIVIESPWESGGAQIGASVRLTPDGHVLLGLASADEPVSLAPRCDERNDKVAAALDAFVAAAPGANDGGAALQTAVKAVWEAGGTPGSDVGSRMVFATRVASGDDGGSAGGV